MSRPFTRTHKVLSDLFPVFVGVTGAGILSLFTLEPSWFRVVYGVAFAMLIPCGLARLHRHRRIKELDLVTFQRGWRKRLPEHHIFTRAEVEEIGRLRGKYLAEAIRVLGARGSGVQGP